MPFSLKDAPATFQRAMNATLSEFIGTRIFVFLYDIVIYSETFKSTPLTFLKFLESSKKADFVSNSTNQNSHEKKLNI